jgi:phage terminase Nu1 subunit (DNA packaging protein)
MMKDEKKHTANKVILAEYLGVAPATIDDYQQKGLIVKLGMRSYDVKESVQKVVTYFRNHMIKKSTGEVDALKEAKTEETILKSRKLELDIAKDEKNLIDAYVAQTAYSRLAREVAVWVDKIPDSMERKGVISKDGIESLRQECDAMRLALFNKLNQDDVFSEVSEQQPDDSEEPDSSEP